MSFGSLKRVSCKKFYTSKNCARVFPQLVLSMKKKIAIFRRRKPHQPQQVFMSVLYPDRTEPMIWRCLFLWKEENLRTRSVKPLTRGENQQQTQPYVVWFPILIWKQNRLFMSYLITYLSFNFLNQRDVQQWRKKNSDRILMIQITVSVKQILYFLRYFFFYYDFHHSCSNNSDIQYSLTIWRCRINYYCTA